MKDKIYKAYIEWVLERIRSGIIYQDNRIVLHPLNLDEYLLTRADYVPMGTDAIEAELRFLGER